MGEPEMVCATCGHVGKVRIKNRGSVIVLLALFILLIIPGLFYLLYMLTGNYKECRKCGAKDVIGLDSPRGRELVARYGGATSRSW